MTEIERIYDQLNRAYKGGAWHGPSLSELLSDITFEKASRKPLPNSHSIWEIVLHISAWKKESRRRIEGEFTDIPQAQDWPAAEELTTASWAETLKTLEVRQEKLLEAISKLKDEDLEKNAAGQSYSIYFMLHGIVQHDLYHAGQIAILKK